MIASEHAYGDKNAKNSYQQNETSWKGIQKRFVWISVQQKFRQRARPINHLRKTSARTNP